MAEEIPDNRFKSEVVRLLQTAISKVDGLETKVGGLETKINENTRELKSLQTDIRVLSGQFQDVAGLVVKDTQRISNLEDRVMAVESKIE